MVWLIVVPGTKSIKYKDFIFTFKESYKDKQIWKCRRTDKMNCRAKIKLMSPKAYNPLEKGENRVTLDDYKPTTLVQIWNNHSHGTTISGTSQTGVDLSISRQKELLNYLKDHFHETNSSIKHNLNKELTAMKIQDLKIFITEGLIDKARKKSYTEKFKVMQLKTNNDYKLTLTNRPFFRFFVIFEDFVYVRISTKYCGHSPRW
jgi:hypothetical protein